MAAGCSYDDMSGVIIVVVIVGVANLIVANLLLL